MLTILGFQNLEIRNQAGSYFLGHHRGKSSRPLSLACARPSSPGLLPIAFVLRFL